MEFTLTSEDVPAGTKTQKNMTRGGDSIVNTLKQVIESGKPALGTRVLYTVFGMLAFTTPAKCRSAHWPLMEKFGLGHGQANTVVHLVLKSDGASAAAESGKSASDVLDDIYSGKKAALRPVHDAVLAELAKLGQYEAAPKKDYISYRRKKQFLMVGPKTATAVELGFSAKELPAHTPLEQMPPNSMCKFTTRVGSADEVDAVVRSWIKQSYNGAG